MRKRRTRVAVGLSGGVDSSVAAALLKERGYDVVGIAMKIWDGGQYQRKGAVHACYGPDETEDIQDAQQVAEKLDIPFKVIDLAREYNQIILKYFRQEYICGRTPNPCIRCNQRIKFGCLLKKAREVGIDFDYFGTGHYAKIAYSKDRGRYLLKRAQDLKKDQSYWLAFLSQEQLSKAMFPLGDYNKARVRKIAKELSLVTHSKHESQDFYSGELSRLIGEPLNPGPILNSEGKMLGTHKGVWFYTIGQRKGLGISADKPLYVTGINKEKNAIIVGYKNQLSHNWLIASHVNTISVPAIIKPINVQVKIRYAHVAAEAVVSPAGKGNVVVRFKQPQQAITPGQIAVFYDEDIVVGAAVIERAGNNITL